MQSKVAEPETVWRRGRVRRQCRPSQPLEAGLAPLPSRPAIAPKISGGAAQHSMDPRNPGPSSCADGKGATKRSDQQQQRHRPKRLSAWLASRALPALTLMTRMTRRCRCTHTLEPRGGHMHAHGKTERMLCSQRPHRRPFCLTRERCLTTDVKSVRAGEQLSRWEWAQARDTCIAF